LQIMDLAQSWHFIFSTEKRVGRDFLLLSALLHTQPVPSTPAVLRPARLDALIFGWLLYTTRRSRCLELIVLCNAGFRDTM